MVPCNRLIAINPKYRRPQHRWTQEERLVLCCARRFFDLKYNEIAKIFSHIYATKIRAEGFPDGLPTRTLTTQWEDMRRRGHKDWRAVHYDVSFDQGPSIYHHLMQIIRNACYVLQIGLVARARDLVQTPQGRPIIPLSHTPRISSDNSIIEIIGASFQNTILHSPIIDQDPHIASIPSSQTPQASQASEATPTNIISKLPAPTEVVSRIRSFALGSMKKQPTRPSQVPSILWRFSNDDSMGINHRSGYIANAFLNEIGNIPTPDERAEEFPTWLEIHVRPRKIPSPFISTSTDPLVAIHRALTRDQNAFVSIIDSTQIESQNVFYMRDLMKQYNIYTPGYRGAKEYVVWGTICRPAIVSSIRADDFIQIANSHSDIKAAFQLDTITASPNCKSQLHNRLALKTFESDFEVGKTVGKFLRIIRLQPAYLEDVSKSLNTSWSWTVSDDVTDFIRGVKNGFHTTIAPSSPVHVPENTFHCQETIIQSQDRSIPDKVAQEVAQNVNLQDYVVVDDPQGEDVAHDIRQSMDRFSIDDDAEGFPVHQRNLVIRSSPAIATTTATRTISVFEPGTESWVMVPETQRLNTPIVESVEDVLPISGLPDNKDNDGGETVQIKTEMPTTPTRNHTRSYSQSSESTISAQTPVADHRLSQERAHVNRVLGYDWPSFWDSLHQVGSQ